MQLDFEEENDPFELATPFLAGISNIYAKLAILQSIKAIAVQKREDICTHALHFIGEPKDPFVRVKIIEAIKAVPCERRAAVCACAKLFTNQVLEEPTSRLINIFTTATNSQLHSILEDSYLVEHWAADTQRKIQAIKLFLRTSDTESFLFCQNSVFTSEPESRLFRFFELWKSFPKDERKSIFLQAQLFIQCPSISEMTEEGKTTLIKKIAQIPSQERSEVCYFTYIIIKQAHIEDACSTLTETIDFALSIQGNIRNGLCVQSLFSVFCEWPGALRKKFVLEVITKIPEEQREKICIRLSLLGSMNFDMALDIMSLLQDLQANVADKILGEVCLLKDATNLKDSLDFMFFFFLCFPLNEIQAVRKMFQTPSLVSLVPLRDYASCFQATFVNSPALYQVTLSKLTSLISSEDDRRYLLLLATSLWEDGEKIGLDDDSPLAQAALNRIIAMQPPHNARTPYQLHRELQQLQHASPRLTLTSEDIGGLEVTLNLNKLQESMQFSVTVDQLPKVSTKIIEHTFEQLEKRLYSLSQSAREETEKEIQQMSEGLSWQNLKNNFNDPYITGLCNLPLVNTVPFFQALFFAIINYIADQPTELEQLFPLAIFPV